jgi:hypothetical protein
MHATDNGFERLHESLRGPVRRYATRLRELFGAHLFSLTIYGPSVVGVLPHRHQSVRSAVVFDTLDWQRMWQLSAEGPRLASLQLAAPLVFTPEWLQNSCDVFPLEFIEIQQLHVTLLGDDVFAPLVFAERDVRLQCERELKVASIALRQRLLSSGGRQRRLQHAGRELAEHLVRTLRGLLWLKQLRQSLDAKQVVAESERLLGRPLPGISHLAAAAGDETTWQQFRDLCVDVKALEQLVDAL